MFDPATVRITYARYRGQLITTSPWATRSLATSVVQRRVLVVHEFVRPRDTTFRSEPFRRVALRSGAAVDSDLGSGTDILDSATRSTIGGSRTVRHHVAWPRVGSPLVSGRISS